MSVNISVVEFRQQDLVERIQQVLDETGLAAEWLELEVTESIVADDIERITKVLDELKALGIGVAIDDFGTGYSSLSYLTRLPFDKLKIDQSFVRNTGPPELGHCSGCGAVGTQSRAQDRRRRHRNDGKHAPASRLRLSYRARLLFQPACTRN